jgi:hypothetical protein
MGREVKQDKMNRINDEKSMLKPGMDPRPRLSTRPPSPYSKRIHNFPVSEKVLSVEVDKILNLETTEYVYHILVKTSKHSMCFDVPVNCDVGELRDAFLWFADALEESSLPELGEGVIILSAPREEIDRLIRNFSPEKMKEALMIDQKYKMRLVDNSEESEGEI